MTGVLVRARQGDSRQRTHRVIQRARRVKVEAEMGIICGSRPEEH